MRATVFRCPFDVRIWKTIDLALGHTLRDQLMQIIR